MLVRGITLLAADELAPPPRTAVELVASPTAPSVVAGRILTLTLELRPSAQGAAAPAGLEIVGQWAGSSAPAGRVLTQRPIARSAPLRVAAAFEAPSTPGPHRLNLQVTGAADPPVSVAIDIRPRPWRSPIAAWVNLGAPLADRFVLMPW